MPNTTGIQIRNLGGMANAIARFGRNLFNAPGDTIRGIDPSHWPSALQPVRPMGQPGSSPLGINIWMGQNLTYTPRPDAQYDAAQLKALSLYPLARLCIENVKDMLCQIPVTIQLRLKPGESRSDRDKRAKGDATIVKLSRFFEYPDGENSWPDWLRPLIDDMLTIDAATILIRRTFAGQIAELRVIPGDTITRYVDDNGFTPKAPDPAYAQLWEGVPRVNLSTDQLIYKPRNIVRRPNNMSSQIYGMSPVEQSAPEIQIGIQRLAFVLLYYTAGAVPDVLHVVPNNVTVDKITEAMQWMNSELAGNLGARRGWRMMQGFREDGEPDQILFPKEKLLSDPFDDLHIRKICFAFGTSPQRLLKMMNRASSESNQDAAEEEGTKPWALWMKSVMDLIIQRKFGFDDYEMGLDLDHENDVVKQMTADTGYTSKAVYSINERRKANGDDPRPEPEADQLGIITATGWVAIDAPPPVPAGAAGSGDEVPEPEPKPKPKPAAAPAPTKLRLVGRVQKTASDYKLDPADDASVRHIRMTYENSLKEYFTTQKGEAAERVKKVIDAHLVGKVRKDGGDDPADTELKDLILNSALNFQSYDLVYDSEDPLYESGVAGAMRGLGQVGVMDTAVIGKQQQLARRYSQDRAAEMVGKKWKDGELVDNPTAKWVIDETTRTKLRDDIQQAFSEETPISKLIAKIKDSGAFSDTRAAVIAKTEVTRSQSRGTMQAWKKTGVVLSTKWVLSSLHQCCDACDLNAAFGAVPVGERYPSGDSEPGAHPNCMCSLQAVEIKPLTAAAAAA